MRISCGSVMSSWYQLNQHLSKICLGFPQCPTDGTDGLLPTAWQVQGQVTAQPFNAKALLELEVGASFSSGCGNSNKAWLNMAMFRSILWPENGDAVWTLTVFFLGNVEKNFRLPPKPWNWQCFPPQHLSSEISLPGTAPRSAVRSVSFEL